MTTSSKFELIKRDAQSILEYAIFIGAGLIINHATGLSMWLSQWIDPEISTSVVALITLILRKYVLSKTYTK